MLEVELKLSGPTRRLPEQISVDDVTGSVWPIPRDVDYFSTVFASCQAR